MLSLKLYIIKKFVFSLTIDCNGKLLHNLVDNVLFSLKQRGNGYVQSICS